jgi:hypothetical protein
MNRGLPPIFTRIREDPKKSIESASLDSAAWSATRVSVGAGITGQKMYPDPCIPPSDLAGKNDKSDISGHTPES